MAQPAPETTTPIVLRLDDATRALDGVRLVPDIPVPAGSLEFTYDDGAGGWRYELPPVPVRRMEYRLELRHPDGSTEVVGDPANPLRASGAFGDKSVLEFAGYRRPEWLDAPTAPGHWRDIPIVSRALRATMPVRVWSPAESDSPARGILFAHDGGEYDRLAGLGRHSAANVASGAMPPHHLVLLSPVERTEWYSANPAYARALASHVLPGLRDELGDLPIVALGASLGALSLLHTHAVLPGAFAGLFLQSGSFFQHRFDAQESNFSRYRRVIRFVADVRRKPLAAVPVPAVLTCGTAEENLANNRDMAATLAGRGYPVRLVEVPDAHNFIAWRDAWHPYLAELATRCWAAAPDVMPAAGAQHGGG